MFRVDIHKTIHGTYNIIQTHLRFKRFKNKAEKWSWNTYDEKLDNNVSRAKTQIYNILSFNEFYFFYTQTISSIYNRSDLNTLVRKISDITREIRKKDKDLKFYYLYIPEYHLDGCSWHIHGFLSKDYIKYMYLNKNGFYSLSCFNDIGWNSVSKINNYAACCKYAVKYATKDLLKSRGKGERLFYCSQNLIRRNLIKCCTTSQIAPIHFKYKNEYVFKTDCTEKEYNLFQGKIKENKYFCYWEDMT